MNVGPHSLYSVVEAKMHFDVSKRTILLARHGSHAYGLNIATSDEDFKGVCVAPKECYLGFTQKFEQQEHMGSKTDGVDKVIYSLNKFAALLTDCNPSIIEVLHVADKDIITCDEYGELLREHRYDFLSKKAKFTFGGYAYAQLRRIKTHHAWMFDPPKAPPTRKEFGLSETTKISDSALGAVNAMYQSENGMLEAGLHRDIIRIYVQENAYASAKARFDQYTNWVKSRNPARAELEAKYGYDTKHGMHLLRLDRMALEIMDEHVVYVDRRNRDRDELLDVRHGRRSFDSLVEEAELLEKACDEAYKTSTLRKEPDRVKLDALIVDMTERYLRAHG